MRRSVRVGLSSLVVLASIVAMATFVLGVGRRVAVGAQEPGGESELRELAERLLAQPYPAGGRQTPSVRLLPGQAPADFPVTVPLLPGGRLVGSIVRGPGVPGTELSTVVLDAPGPLAEVFQFYEQALGGQARA